MESAAASPRVLVVDDDPDVLTSLERGLRLSGSTCDAVDGAEALRSATETRPTRSCSTSTCPCSTASAW